MLIIYSLFQLVHDHDPWQLGSSLLASIWWKSISMSFQLFTRQWKVEESCVKFIAHNILLGRRLIVLERPTTSRFHLSDDELVVSVACLLGDFIVTTAATTMNYLGKFFSRLFFFFSIRKDFQNEKKCIKTVNNNDDERGSRTPLILTEEIPCSSKRHSDVDWKKVLLTIAKNLKLTVIMRWKWNSYKRWDLIINWQLA